MANEILDRTKISQQIIEASDVESVLPESGISKPAPIFQLKANSTLTFVQSSDKNFEAPLETLHTDKEIAVGSAGADGSGNKPNDSDDKMNTVQMMSSKHPIQRNTPPPAPRVQSPQAAPPQLSEKEQFLQKNYGPKNIIPNTGFGGFQAMYTPGGGNGTLQITVQAKIRFIDGLSQSGNTVTSNDAALNTVANKANLLTPAKKAALLAQFQWTPQEKTAKQAEYQKRFDQAAKMWSGAHSLFIDKEDWRDVKAAVQVTITVNGVGDASFEAGGGKDHMQVSAVKSPKENASSIGAAVTDNNQNGKVASELRMADELQEAKHLSFKVLFPNNSAVPNPGELPKLQFIAKKFKDTPKNNISNKIQLIGRASSSGNKESNEKLANQRVEVVFAQLKAFGLDGVDTGRVTKTNEGTTGADESAEFRRVDIIIGSGEKQNVLAHEMGHVFGLGDEYGNAGPLGEKTEHSDLSEKYGAGKSTFESNDSIMSNGNEVRATHYTTFCDAINQLTSQPWKIG